MKKTLKNTIVTCRRHVKIEVRVCVYVYANGNIEVNDHVTVHSRVKVCAQVHLSASVCVGIRTSVFTNVSASEK